MTTIRKTTPPAPPLAPPEEAPRELTDKEQKYVYAIAMRYLKDEEAARDVSQEALLLAHRHRDAFRGDSRFTTWLYRVAATASLMALRKQRRAPVMASLDQDVAAVPEPESDDPSPEDLAAARETAERVEAGLATLGDKYSRVFRMRFLEGYSEREIASELGLNVATVKTRAYRARNQLKLALAG